MAATTKTNNYVRLLTPSIVGAISYTYLTAIVLVVRHFSVIEQAFGLPKNTNFSTMILSAIDHGMTRLLGQGKTDVLVVALFWGFVGLAVYILLQGAARFVNELGEGMEARNYLWPDAGERNQMVLAAVRRTVFRLVAFAGLVLVLIYPLARLLSGPLHGKAVDGGVIGLTVWFVLLWLSMHVSVIFLRLMMLRPRLFN